MEEGKEFGVYQVAPYTGECFAYLHSVTKALMDGSIAAALKARISIPAPNHDFFPAAFAEVNSNIAHEFRLRQEKKRQFGIASDSPVR
jgi:hypothetical protein